MALASMGYWQWQVHESWGVYAAAERIEIILNDSNSDPELKKANEALVKKYKVKGVPTVLLFDAEGKEFSRFIASEHRTVKDFLKKLNTAKRRKDMF